MRRAGALGVLLVVTVVLSLLYGPRAIAFVAVAAAAAYVGRFYPPLPAARPRGRLRQWRRRGHAGELRRRRADLEWALRDGHQADAVLRPGLARTADTLLRGRTDRGLADDPAAARGLLGPELHEYLTNRREVPPTAAQLEAMLTRLEALR